MFLCGDLRRSQLFSKYGLKSYPTCSDVGYVYTIPDNTKTIPDRGSVHTRKNGDFGGRDFCNEAKLSRPDL